MRFNGAMRPIDTDTLGGRLRLARSKRGMNQEDLAAASNMKQGDISKIENGKISQTTGIARIAHAVRVPPLWLELGQGDEPDWENPTTWSSGVAQFMSQLRPQTVPSITREQLMSEFRDSPPEVFRLAAFDEAMAPRVKPGAVLTFSTSEEPRPGDGVLIRDASGAVHFREYLMGRPGVWVAHAENRLYQPMESDRDGLEVIAVLLSVDARWG